MAKKEEYVGRHRDSRNIRRERGKPVIVTYEEPKKKQGK